MQNSRDCFHENSSDEALLWVLKNNYLFTVYLGAKMQFVFGIHILKPKPSSAIV